MNEVPIFANTDEMERYAEQRAEVLRKFSPAMQAAIIISVKCQNPTLYALLKSKLNLS